MKRYLRFGLIIILTMSSVFSGDLKQDLLKNEYGRGVLTPVSPLAFSRTDMPEGRAVWISRFEYNTAEGIRALIDKAADANCNLILFQVRGQADAFYFSSYEPWSDRLGGSYPGFDPLQVAIDHAHSYGIELHAYINTFPMWKGSAPPSSPSHIYNAHPEWVMVDYYGSVMDPAGVTYAFGSPGILAFQDHLYNVAMDIIENYEIDGLHLDYIRYPGNEYSYDTESVTRFQEETGLDAYSHATEYSDWRRLQVENVVRRIYTGLMQTKPEIALSAAVWGNYPSGRNYYFQDSHRWCQVDIIDILCPMIYTENTPVFIDYLNSHVYYSYGKFVYAGIGAYMHSSNDITIEQIQAARDQGAEGSTIFSGSDLTNSLINDLISGPFPEPAPLPEMTWKDYVYIQHEPHPDSEDTTSVYVINANITSTIPIDTSSVFLIYRSLASDGWDTTTMIPSGTGQFTGGIPPVSNSYVNYYIVSRNDSNYHATSPRWAPQFYHSFNVFPDQIPPVISSVYINNAFLLNQPLVVTAGISDNLGLDTSSINLNYRINDGAQQSARMSAAGNIFEYVFPEYINLGDSVFFSIFAQDLSVNQNWIETEESVVVTGSDDFEAGGANWLMGQSWEFQSEIVHHGEQALRIRPTDPAPQNPFIITRDLINPQKFDNISVSFFSYRDIQPTDSCFFEASSDGGVIWEIFLILEGSASYWEENHIDLPRGFAAGSQTGIRFRLRFKSSATQDQYEGWIIDQFQIHAEDISSLFSEKIPEAFFIRQNYPNPFNSRTVIPVKSTQSGTGRISVISIDGKMINEWEVDLHPGLNLITWDVSKNGRNGLASGIYFITINTPEGQAVLKSILLK